MKAKNTRGVILILLETSKENVCLTLYLPECFCPPWCLLFIFSSRIRRRASYLCIIGRKNRPLTITTTSLRAEPWGVEFYMNRTYSKETRERWDLTHKERGNKLRQPRLPDLDPTLSDFELQQDTRGVALLWTSGGGRWCTVTRHQKHMNYGVSRLPRSPKWCLLFITAEYMRPNSGSTHLLTYV